MSTVGSLTTCLVESPAHPAFNPSGDTDATAGPLCNLFGMAPFGADDLGYCGFGGRHFENLSHLSPHAHARMVNRGRPLATLTSQWTVSSQEAKCWPC